MHIVDADVLSRNWWVVLLRGAAGILFVIGALVAPGLSLDALILVFGAYAFVDGILAIASAIRQRSSRDRWWVLLAEGLMSVLAGVVAVVVPGITALLLVYVIAAWALVTGVLEIVAAIRLRKAIAGEWLLGLTGVASVAFALLLFALPGAGALALVLWIGAYSLFFGVLLVALAIRLHHRVGAGHTRVAPHPA